ncbi:MAG: hypothetical protein ACKVOE_03230 [Rickettsiales bacterium]
MQNAAWLSTIQFLSSPHAPYLFCGFILLVFIFALLDGMVRLNEVAKATKNATALIEAAPDSQALYEQFEQLNDRFAKLPLYANAWHEFSKTVILDPVRTLIRITRRPAEYFNAGSIIAARLNIRLFNAMPGYLISLGLFFTFIGLVAAIAIAAAGLGAADVAKTQAALVQLLDVASLKFISSVAGISLSIILSVAQKAQYNRVTLLLSAFGAAIERRTQLVTMEQLLQQWLASQENVTRGYAHLAEDIATEIALQIKKV